MYNLFSDLSLVIWNEKSNTIQTNANNTNWRFFFGGGEGEDDGWQTLMSDHSTATATQKNKANGETNQVLTSGKTESP